MGLISAVAAFEGGKWAPQREVKVVKKGKGEKVKWPHKLINSKESPKPS